MKIRSLGALLTVCTGLAACDSMKEALTAHVDVVARTNDQELSVERLSNLLGGSTLQIPVNRETAGIVADLWSGYQLLAIAAARGDSVVDPKIVEEATRAITANMRLRRYMEGVSSGAAKEQASEATYSQAAGGLFHARHILFAYPGAPGSATQAQKDSVRRRAQTVRAQVTPGNFADLAKRHSGDPGSSARGGDLGTFPREMMVKPFGDAVAALSPGQISGLVETEYGYHIVQRSTYAAARAEYDARYNESLEQRAESTYIAKVDDEAKVTLKSGAVANVKAAARNLATHGRDRDVLASFNGGTLTLGQFVGWVELMPPQARVAQQIQQQPDSIIATFLKSVARNEVLLKKADSAGVVLTAEELQSLHGEFKRAIQMLWGQLGLDPRMLADSARSVPERERLAAGRIEQLLDRIMAGQAQAVSIPPAAQSVLALMYSSKTTSAGLDRAVERATRIRASADSARLAEQPASQVPMPGSPATAPDARGKRP